MFLGPVHFHFFKLLCEVLVYISEKFHVVETFHLVWDVEADVDVSFSTSIQGLVDWAFLSVKFERLY